MKIIFKQQMIGLVIKAPLAQSNVSSRLLNFSHHVNEILLLLIGQLGIVLSIGYIQIVFGLWLGRFKGAGQNGYLGVFETFGHLWMREVLVNKYALNELSLS